jgi:hypothetical protein
MALIVIQRLQPSSQNVVLPATITFTAVVRDDEAPADPSREVALTLEPDNDLTFAGDGKRKTVQVKIPAKASTLSFTETIQGTGAGLAAFRVALVLSDTLETGCLVNLQ